MTMSTGQCVVQLTGFDEYVRTRQAFLLRSARSMAAYPLEAQDQESEHLDPA
ncbi:hypothetical protein [Streptomyces sp. NPDC016845]|uniref:hypothetical protein n=1 Tax=Streptomyces sp. NPDC016845 TaxID=3364972 RepID=UPI0037B5CEA4